MTYRFGPGPAKVHVKVAFIWDIKPVYDAIAWMRGSQEPDLWVIRGNHHDAWVKGADDPISGQVALLEEARGLGEMARQGWKPKRTIIYTSWDGGMSRSPAQVRLSPEEESTLRSRTRKGTSEQRLVERAKIILLSHQGVTVENIAQRLNTRPARVSKCRQRFAQDRLSALSDAPRLGKPRTYNAETESLDQPSAGGLRAVERPASVRGAGRRQC